MVADWVDPARMQMLTSFGGGEEWREPQGHFLSRGIVSLAMNGTAIESFTTTRLFRDSRR